MKKIIILIILAGGIQYVFSNHSPFQETMTEPYFVEIRVDDRENDIQLVGFGEMLSHEDCLGRAAIFWASVFEHIGKIEADATCSTELPERYQPLFDNQQFSATYVAFDKGSDGERNGRFVFYGVPSSVVAKACSRIISKAKQRYKGEIYCVQGHVG
ncbi:MAG TPA: hypothetical protein ENI97_02885 [Gammaproteobacteria bacterium]|nr:hypothetical protein [Gammaproteobacteria bacterium]